VITHKHHTSIGALVGGGGNGTQTATNRQAGQREEPTSKSLTTIIVTIFDFTLRPLNAVTFDPLVRLASVFVLGASFMGL
jgi:hypothetical protein